MTTERLYFQREHQPAMVELRYETDDDARVREYLKSSLNRTDEQIDQMFIHYHFVGRARLQLGIK